MARIRQHQTSPTYPWQVFTVVDTNAGIPYCFPWEPPRFRGTRQNVALMPTEFVCLTPDTLPVGIAGMAWWYPFDQPPRKQTKHWIHPQPAYGTTFGLPVPISGMAWYGGWEPPHFPRKTKVTIQQTQMFVWNPAFAPVGIAGMAWYYAWDQPKRRRADVVQMPTTTQVYARSPWKGYYNVKITGGGR